MYLTKEETQKPKACHFLAHPVFDDVTRVALHLWKWQTEDNLAHQHRVIDRTCTGTKFCFRNDQRQTSMDSDRS